MAFTSTPGYTWTDGEVVTAVKLNSAATPTIADNQSFAFSIGAVSAPSMSFSGDTGTGLYRISSGNIGLVGSLVVDTSTVSYPAIATGLTGQLRIFDDGVSTFTHTSLTTFGANISVNGYAFGGNRVTAAATLNGQVFRHELDAWDGVAGSAYPVAKMDLLVDGNQTSGNHGGYVTLSGTTNGGTTLAEWMRIQSGKTTMLNAAVSSFTTAGIVTNDASGNLATTANFPSLTVTSGGDARSTTSTTNATSTAVAVSGLSVALAASTTYFFQFDVTGSMPSSSANPDIILTGSGGLTVSSLNGSACNMGSATNALGATQFTALGADLSAPAISNARIIYWRGSGVLTTTNAGNLILQCKVIFPDGNTLTILAGSTLSIRKIV